MFSSVLTNVLIYVYNKLQRMLRCIDLYVNSFVLILPWDELTIIILCTVLCIPSFSVLLMKITGKSRHVALLILKCGVARIIFLKRQAKKKKRKKSSPSHDHENPNSKKGDGYCS